MVTIKELATEAGVSPSTVSIVMNGKAEERKISKKTQIKIMDAAQRIGYRPNVSARRLRMCATDTLVLAVFWTADFCAPMMVRFLRGLQRAVSESDRVCEIILHTYENDKLAKSMKNLSMYNASIICNPSEVDLSFLDENAFAIPIVLYNRSSERYCNVSIDDECMGSMAASIFASRGRKTAILLTSDSVFPGMELRNTSFMRTAQEKGMNVIRLHQENSMAGGYQGALAAISLRPLPDSLFCISDAMAMGTLRAFAQQGVRIPDDLELISIGNGDEDMEEYASVSLSVVRLPTEEMAASCFQLALKLIDDIIKPPYSIELPVEYRQRESCGY